MDYDPDSFLGGMDQGFPYLMPGQEVRGLDQDFLFGIFDHLEHIVPYCLYVRRGRFLYNPVSVVLDDFDFFERIPIIVELVLGGVMHEAAFEFAGNRVLQPQVQVSPVEAVCGDIGRSYVGDTVID